MVIMDQLKTRMKLGVGMGTTVLLGVGGGTPETPFCCKSKAKNNKSLKIYLELCGHPKVDSFFN